MQRVFLCVCAFNVNELISEMSSYGKSLFRPEYIFATSFSLKYDFHMVLNSLQFFFHTILTTEMVVLQCVCVYARHFIVFKIHFGCFFGCKMNCLRSLVNVSTLAFVYS